MKLNDNYNKKYTIIAIYVIITAIIIYCLSLVAKNAPIIMKEILEIIGWFIKVTKPIVIAFVIAYLLEPVNNFLEEKYSRIKIKKWRLKSCRTFAVITTLLLFFIVIVAIVSLLVFNITNQMRLAKFEDLTTLATTYFRTINDFYFTVLDKLDQLNIESTEIKNYVTEVTTYLISTLRNFGLSTVNSVTNISSKITTFLFSLVISIYFMIDGRLIKAYLRKVRKALFSEKWDDKMSQFLEDADTVFSGYIRGQLSDAVIMLILISVILSVIGVKFGILIGVLAGIGNLIPYVGPIIAYASTVLACLLNGQYKELLIALIALLIVQVIDGNIIAPKLLSKSIEIHPVLVIISLIFGSAIGGFLGMLLAVPVGALIKVLFVRFIDSRLESKNSKTD